MPVLGVQAEYLEAALAEMRGEYGDVETGVADGLRVDSATIQTLRGGGRYRQGRPAGCEEITLRV